MGAEFYNSYNWHKFGDAYFLYACDFLTGWPSITHPPIHAKRSAPATITFSSPGDLQAFTRINVPVCADRSKGMAVALAVEDESNHNWFSERQTFTQANHQRLTFVFPVPAEVKWHSTGVMRLHSYDARGKETHGAVVFADDAEQQLRLTSDLELCRTLSLIAIHWRQAAQR